MDLDIEIENVQETREEVEEKQDDQSSSQEDEDVVEELPNFQPFDNSYTVRTDVEGLSRSVFKSK